MMDLNQTRIFVEVVRAGSFAAAARSMGLPKSTVSARVRALEARLGAQLLRRSTRRLALTSEGSAFFDSVADALDSLVRAEAATSASDGVLSGTIRFTAPLEFPRAAITNALASFCRLHPMVRFELILSNEPLDLVARNIDLALRGGEPGGADLIIRKVGEIDFGLFASPDYLARFGRPADLAELQQHDLLLFASPSESRALRAADPLVGREPRITSDNFAFLRELALAGVGVVALPRAVVTTELAAGQLEHLLAEWTGEPASMFLVFPSRRDISPRVRAFADHLVAALGDRQSSI